MMKAKFSIISLLVMFLFISVSASARPTVVVDKNKVTVQTKTVSLKSVISEIEKNSEYKFFYKSGDIDLTVLKEVDYSGDISAVLATLFEGTSISYTIKGTDIILKRSTSSVAVDQKVERRTITGVVVDEFGDPIIGASVLEEGTTNGTITNIDGEFVLTVEQSKLKITYIGFAPRVLSLLPNKDQYKVVLREDTKLLEEVVVVGYGTQKKVNLTGSVAAVNTKDLQDRVQTDVLKAIQGTVPGVTVISRPGQTPSINFRGRGNLGSSEPLYVIDGAIADATFFSNLDPNSIESISFLKDAASSAIYGSRAAYGVVLVTTKEGNKERLTVNYSGHVGVKIADFLPKLVNSAQYAELLNEARYNTNPAGGMNQAFSDEEIGWFKDGSKPDYYPNTDWVKESFDKNVLTTQHSLNFSGGTERIRYFTGLGYTYDDSNNPGQDMKRYNLNMTLNADVTDWLTLNSGIKYIKRDSKRTNGEVTSRNYLIVPPTMVAQQSNGEWGSIVGGKQATQEFINLNPLRTLNKADWYKGVGEYSLYDLGFDIKPIENLIIKAQGSYKRSENKSKTYTALQDDVKHFETGNPIPGTGNKVNSMNMSWGSASTLLTTLTANYSFAIDKHSISTLLGTSYEDFKYEGLGAGRKNFPLDNFEDLNAGSSAGTDISNSGGMQSNKMLSYFGRVNYNYDERYLFEANFRADASSRFHKDNRWGYFPSFSAAWRLSEEEFMENSKDWLDNLKLRVSWGELGNINNVGNYDYFMKYAVNSNYNFDDNVAMGIGESKIANEKLGWETVRLTNFGVDADFWNGKLSVVADYYIKETSNILLQYNVPYETGITAAPSQNIGKVRNSGFEFAISHQNSIADFNYAIAFNIATNRNRIKDLSGSDNMIQYGGDKIRYILKEGQSIGSYYGYQTDGLYTQEEIDAGHYYVLGRTPNAGDIKYVPQRENVEWGDAITGEDRTILGKDVPDFTYGLNINLNWKNFELGLFGQGVSGTKVAFESEQVWAFFTQAAPRDYHLKRWNENNANPRAAYPRIYGGTENDTYNQYFSNYQLFNADYFRLKTIYLGYQVPKTFTNRLGINNLKLFLTGENLLTIRGDKKMKDFDPEALTGRGYGTVSNKSIAFGLNVSF